MALGMRAVLALAAALAAESSSATWEGLVDQCEQAKGQYLKARGVRRV